MIFESESSDLAGLTLQIEEMLASKFRYEARAVLQSRKQLFGVVKKAPKGFGAQPARYRYDVLFLKPPMIAPAVMKDLPCKTGVDRAWAGRGVVYYSRLISKAAQSRLSRVVSMAMYQSMTIRNWNTTTKLLSLMEAAER